VTPPGIFLTAAQSARLAAMSSADRNQLIGAIVAELRVKLRKGARRTAGLRGRRA
jgi:hypothetical protein